MFANSRRILFPSGTIYSRVARRQSPNHSRDASGQSSGATDKASETVLDASEGKSAETDEKEVTVNSDRKIFSCDGKDDLVTQLPRDFIASAAKKRELYVSEKHPVPKMKYGGFKHGVKPQAGTFI